MNMKEKGVMRSIETRSEEEILDENECRNLYNKVVSKMTANKFSVSTSEDKLMLEQLRRCEKRLKEMSYYSDLIYQKQVQRGRDEEELDAREKEREEREMRKAEPFKTECDTQDFSKTDCIKDEVY